MKRFFIKDQKDAEKYYKKMKGAVMSVAQHPDFKVFIEYWETAYAEVDASLSSLKGDALEKAVLKRTVIENHLNWVNNLLKD